MEHAVIFSPAEFKDFLSKLEDIVGKQLKSHVIEKPMTSKEAAAYLKIGESTLWDRIRKGSIPTRLVHRSAGSVYFFASELHQYLKSN